MDFVKGLVNSDDRGESGAEPTNTETTAVPDRAGPSRNFALNFRHSSLSQPNMAKRAIQNSAGYATAAIPVRRSSTFFNSKILFTDDPFYEEDPPAPKSYHSIGGTIPEMPQTVDFLRIRNELDIVRITNQIIVTGNISSGKSSKKNFVNNHKDLAKFINTRYGHRYMVWNLNSAVDSAPQELDYDASLFRNQIQHVDLQVSYKVTLQAFFEICQSIETWLEIDGRHVAVIHCTDGRARTSLAVACYLKFSEKFESTQEAFEYFCARRSPSDSTWINCLHHKYLQYFNDVLSLHGKVPRQDVLSLKSLICTSIPDFGRSTGGLRPLIEVYECGELVYSISLYRADDGSDAYPLKPDKEASDYLTALDGSNMVLQVPKNHQRLSRLERDVQIVISHVAKNGVEHMLTCIFHTGFLRPNFWRLEQRDLFILPKNKHRFPSDFFLDLVLEESAHADKKVTYEPYIGLGKLKGLVKLSFYHIVRPEEKLIKALEEASYNPRLAKFALQLYNNEIHDAHAYLREFLLSSEFNEGFTKDLQEAKKYILKKKLSSSQMSSRSKSVENQGRSTPQRTDSLREERGDSPANASLELASPLYQSLQASALASPDTARPSSRSSIAGASKPTALQNAAATDVPSHPYSTGVSEDPTVLELETSSTIIPVDPTVGDNLDNCDGKNEETNGDAEAETLEERGSSEVGLPPPPPPPPPPFLGGGPPPPPPPPPGSGATTFIDPKKPRMKSKLNWSDITHSKKVSRNSVWVKAMEEINMAKSGSTEVNASFDETSLSTLSLSNNDGGVLSTENLGVSLGRDEVKRFEEMFCIIPGQVTSAVNNLNAGTVSQKFKETLYFLDVRRAQNMGIALARFTRRDLTIDDLYVGLLSMNTRGTLDIEDIQTLQSLMPTTEEKKQAAKYLAAAGDKVRPSELEPSEQLVLLVMRDPNIPHYMDALLFTSGFEAEQESLTRDLAALASIYRSIQQSNNLMLVLKAVLEVGSLAAVEYGQQPLNRYAVGGHAPQQDPSVVGFKVGSLQRLKEVKSNDGKLTLLDFLVQTLAEKSPEALQVSLELLQVQQLRLLNASDLDNQGRLLLQGISRLRSYKPLEFGYSFMGPLPQAKELGGPFDERLGPILDVETRKVEELRQTFAQTQKSWEDLAEYLGEDHTEYIQFSMDKLPAPPAGREVQDPNQVLRHLSVFFTSLDTAHEQLRSRLERERKRLERAEASEAKSAFLKRHSSPRIDDQHVAVGRNSHRYKSNLSFGPDEKTPREALLESIRAAGSAKGNFLRNSSSSSSIVGSEALSEPGSPRPISKNTSCVSLPTTPTPSSPFSQTSSINSISFHINPANYDDIEFCEFCKFPKPHCLC